MALSLYVHRESVDRITFSLASMTLTPLDEKCCQTEKCCQFRRNGRMIALHLGYFGIRVAVYILSLCPRVLSASSSVSYLCCY
jgi:hypothetical protein